MIDIYVDSEGLVTYSKKKITTVGNNGWDKLKFYVPEIENASWYLKLEQDRRCYKADLGDSLVFVVQRGQLLEGKVKLQVQAEIPTDGDVVVFQSNMFQMTVDPSIAADSSIPTFEMPYLQELDVRIQENADRAEAARKELDEAVFAAQEAKYAAEQASKEVEAALEEVRTTASVKTMYELPSIGEEGILYVTTATNELYIWNPDELKYEVVGGGAASYEIISGGSAIIG